MSSVLDKLDKILVDNMTDLDEPVSEDDAFDTEDILDEFFTLLDSLDPDSVTEDQAGHIANIIDMLDPEEAEGEIAEAFKKRTRRDLAAARTGRRERRKKKTKLRLKARTYRRSAAGKITMKRAKRMGKFGRTATGKRQRKFVGPKGQIGKRL